MVKKCIINDCFVKNYKDENEKKVSMYKFSKTREDWIKNIQILTNQKITKIQLVQQVWICEKHFEKKFFKQGERKILKKEAVPTIFVKCSFDNDNNDANNMEYCDVEYLEEKNVESDIDQNTIRKSIESQETKFVSIDDEAENSSKNLKSISKLRSTLSKKNKKIKILQRKIQRKDKKIKNMDNLLQKLSSKNLLFQTIKKFQTVKKMLQKF